MFARGSLAVRLALVASLWSLAVLAFAGVVLSRNYEARAERQFAAVANVYLLNLIAAFNAASGEVDPEFGEPRFDLFGSGYSWQVTEGAELVAVSPSRAGVQIQPPPLDRVPYNSDFVREMRLDDNGERVLALERLVIVGEKARALNFLVAMPLSALNDDISSFSRSLVVFLVIFGAGLVAATVFIIVLGLRPLASLRAKVEAVIDGSSETVEGVFPREIAPVSDEINRLISQNRNVIERARSHVGNLAHALKTPLSVIVNEAAGGRGARYAAIGEQAAAIRRLVDYHLERARTIAVAANPGTGAEVAPIIAGLERAMRKIHADRNLNLTVDIPFGLRFRGDARDLEEMSGNLIDNACKWAAGKVSVRAEAGGIDPRTTFVLIVEDDGPGIAPGQRDEAVQRGRRLDEQTPGTGLGLSIVADLAEAYEGGLELGDSPLGGLRAALTLPATGQRGRRRR
ncbi:MAG: sensor histidine kinase [Rhodobiaceae bacterium]|nr:sensor histidine kinase [Rhodobiaceae bacterium]MCC0054668.1 sensor histidine kinase [Rhodobiaceae bacterium]